MSRKMIAFVAVLLAGAAALGGVVGAALVAGRAVEAQPVTLTAGKVVLLDGTGIQRGVIEIAPGGSAHLALTGPNSQNPRVALSVDERNVPEVALRDGLGVARAGLRIETDGTVSLDMMDSRNRLRLSLGAGPDGAPYLSFLDSEGTVIWSAP